jgi:hypothetical protein
VPLETTPRGADASRTRIPSDEGTIMDDTDARTAVQESMDRRDQGESS